MCVFSSSPSSSTLLLPFESVLNMMFNICQCLCRARIERETARKRAVKSSFALCVAAARCPLVIIIESVIECVKYQL